MQLLRLLAAVVCFVEVSTECDKRCRDFYYNCRALDGVPTDKPSEVVNCDENKFKLRCPELCNLCTDCDFVTKEELAAELSGLEKSISELEVKLKKELEEKVEDVVANLSELEAAADSEETTTLPASGPVTLKEGQLDPFEVSAPEAYNPDLTYPISSLVDGVLETQAEKAAADGNGFGGYCYSSAGYYMSHKSLVVKLAMAHKLAVDKVRILARTFLSSEDGKTSEILKHPGIKEFVNLTRSYKISYKNVLQDLVKSCQESCQDLVRLTNSLVPGLPSLSCYKIRLLLRFSVERNLVRICPNRNYTDLDNCPSCALSGSPMSGSWNDFSCYGNVGQMVFITNRANWFLACEIQVAGTPV